MARHRTSREEMFIKAWKLKAFNDEPRSDRRRREMEDFCNALAFYADLLVPLPPPGPSQARMEKKVNKSRKIGDSDAAQVNYISDNIARQRLLEAAHRVVSKGFPKAAFSYFVEDNHLNVVGAKLGSGRKGPHAAAAALVVMMKLNAEWLYPEFARVPQFTSGLISADNLNLATP